MASYYLSSMGDWKCNRSSNRWRVRGENELEVGVLDKHPVLHHRSYRYTDLSTSPSKRGECVGEIEAF